MPSSPGFRDWSPTFRDIAEAATRLAPLARRTPLLEAPLLNELVGGRVLVKAEPLQRTGSFKFRGAYNRISRLSEAEKQRGVVAFSSGNHAQGVAHAAQLCGLPAVIVMPGDAPAIKIANTRAYGAEVVLYDRLTEDREAIGDRIASERGCVLVRPYDDPYIIAGQGTVGLELSGQLAADGIVADAVLCPCGGGGLIAGTSLAIKHLMPGVPVYAVEPRGFDDTTRSLAGGKRVANTSDARSLCDALLAPTPGELTFSINRQTLAGGLAVADDMVLKAMSAAFRHLKIVVEPGGAVALAAVLSGIFDGRGNTVAVIASGGNADPHLFARAIASEESQ